jgi:hypothetical protein
MRFRANHDYAKAFENNLEELIENMKPQAGSDVQALIAVVDLMEAPEPFEFVAKKVPELNGEIE